jgi:membrane fusion protein (multidrug efflux system)
LKPVAVAGGVEPPLPSEAPRPAHSWRKWLILAAVLVGLAIAGYFLIPWVDTAINTISTDDAYVNSHVTFVAPRVGGQVTEVLVDDNYRVKKGQVLVKLDREPYQVQVAIKQAAVDAAQRDLEAANAQVRGQVALIRSNRYKLEHAIENVNTQAANLRSAVETLNLANDNLRRGEELAPSGGISKEDLAQRRQTVKIDEAAVTAIRVGLGLRARPEKGNDLAEVPPDLDQNFSVVRQALAELIQSAAQIGYFPTRWDATPKQAVEDFYKQDPKGDLDKIYANLIPKAPGIKQAEAKLVQAQSDLAQAKLNLRYCDIVSEIDGVVTRRNVNPGNYIQVGQNLMAVRSLTEIWIDCNFKETQLADLRIGQRVRCEVDMYGSRREYEGRITGFTMGTGETLSLLPPQNATGNFVKIVQRLPVRVELTGYDPEKEPLFVGLSVTPYVYYKEPPSGKNAGAILQPLMTQSAPQGTANPKRQ